jgi:hypothetical protein
MSWSCWEKDIMCCATSVYGPDGEMKRKDFVDSIWEMVFCGLYINYRNTEAYSALASGKRHKGVGTHWS